MTNKFGRFTKKARRVLAFANEESQVLKHGYIGPEHLLLGLLRTEDGLAAQVLRNLAVDLPRMRSAIGDIVGRGERAVRRRIGLTPATKRVIELAVAEAERLNHHYIGTEHLLLALTRVESEVVHDILKRCGLNPEVVREHTLELLQGKAYTAEASPDQSPVVDTSSALYSHPTQEPAWLSFLLGVVVGSALTYILSRMRPKEEP
ncbi:MAG: hypothetical protein M3220_13440 [Chloroflexota bacterium]|nr:hypothetical protein [Chloroflexota bacterium]